MQRSVHHVLWLHSRARTPPPERQHSPFYNRHHTRPPTTPAHSRTRSRQQHSHQPCRHDLRIGTRRRRSRRNPTIRRITLPTTPPCQLSQLTSLTFKPRRPNETYHLAKSPDPSYPQRDQERRDEKRRQRGRHSERVHHPPTLRPRRIHPPTAPPYPNHSRPIHPAHPKRASERERAGRRENEREGEGEAGRTRGREKKEVIECPV